MVIQNGGWKYRKLNSMKKAEAKSFFTCTVDCPHCYKYIDTENLVKIDPKHLTGATELDYHITCPNCKKEFIINEIVY